jgi:dihydrofolate reductase
MSRKVILYIAMSLDGFIATEEDNLDFLSQVESPGEDYGHGNFLQGIDTVIWGRRTFDTVLSFGKGVPYKDKSVYVISRSRSGQKGHAQYAPDVAALIQTLRQEPGKDIYCDGGGEIVFELLRLRLIDRLIVSVIPHLLGSGIRLFKDGRPEQNLRFKRSISYPSGLVQLWYDAEKKGF